MPYACEIGGPAKLSQEPRDKIRTLELRANSCTYRATPKAVSSSPPEGAASDRFQSSHPDDAAASPSLPGQAQAKSVIEPIAEKPPGICKSFRMDSRYRALHLLLGRFQHSISPDDHKANHELQTCALEFDLEACRFLMDYDWPVGSLEPGISISVRFPRQKLSQT